MARRARRSRRQTNTQGFAWMLVGLGLGLLVAAGVYFSGWRVDEAGNRGASTAARAARQAPIDPTVTPAAAASSADTAVPAAASDAAESRFDFYDILPQYEVIVPEVETVTAPSARPAAVAAPGSYILQTGSFRSHNDADRMQASLALLGIESRIQRVTIDDDVYHRVRVGPISDLDQLNRLRAQLRSAGVESLMMKVNE
jgi:cell division protein FtsN